MQFWYAYEDGETLARPQAVRVHRAALYGGASTVGSQLGRRIRELREARSITQGELAERTGLSISFLSMVERAQRAPTLSTLSAISNALGLTLSQLFQEVNVPRTNIGQPREFPLIPYLETLRLNPDEVNLLLVIAKAMFEGRS